MSTRIAAGLPTLDTNTTIGAHLPHRELLVAFPCGCTYMRIIRKHTLVTTTEEEDANTMEAPPVVADNICLMCDIVTRINADLGPVTLAVTASTESDPLGLKTEQISESGKQHRPSLNLITDLDKLNERTSPESGVHSALDTGATLDNEFSVWAARWVAERGRAVDPMGDRQSLYLADDELTPISLISIDDDLNPFLIEPIGRVPNTRDLPELIESCHCSRCREDNEVSPTVLVVPRVCIEWLRTIEADFILSGVSEMPLIEDNISPLGGQAIDDSLFDEALALLDDHGDDASDMVRWTLDRSDSENGIQCIDARDSLELPYPRRTNDPRQSTDSEVSFDLPIQRPEPPIMTTLEETSDQSRHISVVDAEDLERLLEPYRVEGVFDETAEQMYPIKKGPSHYLFRKCKAQTTKKFLLERIKDNIVQKLKAVFYGRTCEECNVMRG